MTTVPGRKTVSYLVRCALAAGDTLIKNDQNGTTYTFPGEIGVCPGWKNGGILGNSGCVEAISACMMAHVNTAGIHIPLWLDSGNGAIGWGVSPNFPYQEGTFFGNIFDTGSLSNTGKPNVSGPAGFYCDGVSFNGGSTGEVAGRLGSNQPGSPYSNPFGSGVQCQKAAGTVGYFSNGTGTSCAGGTSCPDGYSKVEAPAGTPWSNTITVWRNPSYTPVFDPAYRYTIQALSTHANPMAVDGATGAAVQQLISANLSTSQFIFTPIGTRWSIAMSDKPTKCLDAGTGASEVAVTLQTCQASATSQQWTITPHANSYGEFTLPERQSRELPHVEITSGRHADRAVFVGELHGAVLRHPGGSDRRLTRLCAVTHADGVRSARPRSGAR